MLRINEKCIGKQRVKFSSSNVCYTPYKTKKFEQFLGMYVKNYIKKENIKILPKNDPVMLVLYVYKKVPSSWSKSKKALALSGEIRPTKKPDSSNMLKIVEDSMNKIAYDDDVQIVDTVARCFYSEKDFFEIAFFKSPKIDVFLNSIPIPFNE